MCCVAKTLIIGTFYIFNLYNSKCEKLSENETLKENRVVIDLKFFKISCICPKILLTSCISSKYEKKTTVIMISDYINSFR